MISICGECDSTEIERWLTCDLEDQGFQTMNDEEIVEFISNIPDDTEEDEEQQNEEKTEPPVIPSNNDAFLYLEEALKWFEGQEECDPHRLLCLKSIRDVAAKKRLTVHRQTRMTDFLKKD
uniref:Uncharacterized protein n=1 Tax=Trichuris muris TaxID=70415 RepID=A0A5S6PZL9_TRIMR